MRRSDTRSAARVSPGARGRLSLAVVAALALLIPGPASAQFSDPCDLPCLAVLGTTSFVTATGVSIAVGRATGGLTKVDHGLLVWGGSFAVVMGSGMALSGNGERQERAVYAAGVGTIVGALGGLAARAVHASGDGPRMLAGTLIGAAVGAVAGGVYGALSYGGAGAQDPVPVLSVSIPL